MTLMNDWFYLNFCNYSTSNEKISKNEQCQIFNLQWTNKKSKIAKVRLTIKRFRYLPDAYLYIVSCSFGIEQFKNFLSYAELYMQLSSNALLIIEIVKMLPSTRVGIFFHFLFFVICYSIQLQISLYIDIEKLLI